MVLIVFIEKESLCSQENEVCTQETPPLNRDRQKLSKGISCRMSAVTAVADYIMYMYLYLVLNYTFLLYDIVVVN